MAGDDVSRRTWVASALIDVSGGPYGIDRPCSAHRVDRPMGMPERHLEQAREQLLGVGRAVLEVNQQAAHIEPSGCC